MHHRSQTKTHLHPISLNKHHQGIINGLSGKVGSGMWCATFLIQTFMNWDPTRCARGWPWDHHLSVNVVSDASMESFKYYITLDNWSTKMGWSNMIKLDNWSTNIYTTYLLPKTPCMQTTANILMKLSFSFLFNLAVLSTVYCQGHLSSQKCKEKSVVSFATRQPTGKHYWESRWKWAVELNLNSKYQRITTAGKTWNNIKTHPKISWVCQRCTTVWWMRWSLLPWRCPNAWRLGVGDLFCICLPQDHRYIRTSENVNKNTKMSL